VRNGYSSAESASGAREDRSVTKGESGDGGCGSGFGDGFVLGGAEGANSDSVSRCHAEDARRDCGDSGCSGDERTFCDVGNCGGADSSCSCADGTRIDSDSGSCAEGACFGVERIVTGACSGCDCSGLTEVVNGGGSVGSYGAEFLEVGGGGIGDGLFGFESAGGYAAAAAMLKDQAAAALLVAVVVGARRMALEASAEALTSAATPVSAPAGRLRELAAAQCFNAPRPLSGPTRKQWSRWTGHGVVLKSRQMHGGSSALLSAVCYCYLQVRYFGRFSDVQLAVWSATSVRYGVQHHWGKEIPSVSDDVPLRVLRGCTAL